MGAGNAFSASSITIKHIDVADDVIIVRGELKATPRNTATAPHLIFGAGFSNVAGKSCTIMTIDTHKINSHGRIVKSFHIEDWNGCRLQTQN